MKPAEALRIVRQLADGIDPVTGEIFPAESPYQQPQIVRALFAANSALERAKQHEDKSQPANAGKPWEQAEDESLLAAFDEGTPIRELARHHQRTIGAIQARLVKHGRLEPTAEAEQEAVVENTH